MITYCLFPIGHSRPIFLDVLVFSQFDPIKIANERIRTQICDVNGNRSAIVPHKKLSDNVEVIPSISNFENLKLTLFVYKT